MTNTSIPCPATMLPTKADITNAFSSIASMPSKLELQGLDDEAQKIRDVLKTIKVPLSSYYPDFKGIEMPELEWEITATGFIQDFNVYVPTKILEVVSSVVPIEFNVSVGPVTVDLKKLLTGDGKAALKESVRENIDKIKLLLPTELKNFQGINGLEIPELQVEVASQWISTQIQGLSTDLIFSGVNKVLGIAELTKIKMPTAADFDIKTALGGEINETIVSAERTQQRIGQTLADFKQMNVTKLLKDKIEALPLDEIGLSALTKPLNIDCCGFFKIIGVPTSINLPDTTIKIT